jgi:hypothetical protein
MTNEQIGHLIAARNAITDRTEDYINDRAADHIDAVLSDIPIGQRPDVDALLGRRANYIPKQHMTIDAARTKADAMVDAYHAHLCGVDCGLSAADMAEMDARSDETANVMEDNR